MSTLPSEHEMVDRIVATYREATPEQRVAGARWYPTAGRIVDLIAADTGAPTIRVAHALAALSPRNPWLWNVADCYAYSAASQFGAPRPSATTFKRNQESAWAALTGDAQPWLTAAPKVRAFVSAILGLRSAVVVDVWAYRVATGESPKQAVPAKHYVPVAEAYAEAARLLGQDARDVQATTWLVAQTAGLASNRRGRSDLVYKAGTHQFVRDITGGGTL